MGLLRSLLGIGADELTPGQMALRAVLTFIVTVAAVRLGHKRLFGRATAFDLVVAIMVGSVMSRAITNAAGLAAIWVGGVVLILLHRLMAALAFRSDWFGALVKGRAVLLVEDGHIHNSGVRKSAVSRLDLDEAMRQEGSEPDLSRIRLAFLERDGSISMVPCKGEARVLEVTVEDNVQVVRIALG